MVTAGWNAREESMTFNILLTISLAICAGGLLWRARRWFAGGVTQADRELSAGARIRHAGSAVLKALFGAKIIAATRGLVVDGLLQMRLYRADRLRWLAHILIFWGFIPLLALHAMDGVVTMKLFPSYYSTLDPWPFLRDLFGVITLAGVGLAIYRRIAGRSRMKTTAMDAVALGLIAAVVLSGFIVKAAKIPSRSEFHSMVEEFYDPTATEDVAALEALWVEEYGLATETPGAEYSQEQLALGREVNEYSCVYCHSKPQSAPVSYAISRALTPVSRDADGGGLVALSYWLHVLVFFGGLAWLPFGKMRHAVSSPLSLIAERCSKDESPSEPALAVKRMLSLDACMQCGLCSDTCSVGVTACMFHNRNILPSVKLASISSGTASNNEDLAKLFEGLTVCTDCLRCTGVCPAGINLQDIWDAVRQEMSARGLTDVYALSPLGIHRAQAFPETFHAVQESLEAQRGGAFAQATEKTVHAAGTFGGMLGGSGETGGFNLCFNCKTCTSSCPVVSLQGMDGLGLAPHQIIHATALGLDDLVASSRMLWACLGCYRCQENCPQGVRVADVLYIHKNNALARMKGALPKKES